MRLWINLGILLVTFVMICTACDNGRQDGMLYVLVTSADQLFNGEAELFNATGQRAGIAPIKNGQAGFAYLPLGTYTLKVRNTGQHEPFLAEMDIQIKSSASDVYYEMELEAPAGPG
jgi:hypothetical protein